MGGGHRVLVHERSALAGEALAAALRLAGIPALPHRRDPGSPPVTVGVGDVLLVSADRLATLPLQGPWTAGAAPRLVVLVDRIDDPLPPPPADHVPSAVVTRDQDVVALVAVVQAVLDGRAVPDDRPPAPRPQLVRPTGTSLQLTQREREVLALLARGARNDAVASELAISPHTVRTHVQNLLAKLGVDNRLAAVAYARRAGYLATPDSGVA